MDYSFWILFLVVVIKPWESAGITNRIEQRIPVRNFRRHIGTPLQTDWEIGLREAAHQALLREHYTDPNLQHHLASAPLIGKQNTATPFGDIAVLARGQLYASHTGYIFVQDPYQNDCDDCHNYRKECAGNSCEVWRPHGHEQLIALWTIKRIRHRDTNHSLRYEIEYTISPISAAISAGFVTRNGRFDYNIPGHIFVIKSDNHQEKNVHNKPYKDQETQHYATVAYPQPHRPGILVGTSPNGYKHTLHSYPGFFTSYPEQPQTQTSDPREIELYKNLIESLAAKTTTGQKGPHRFSLNTGEQLPPTKPVDKQTSPVYVPDKATSPVYLTNKQTTPHFIPSKPTTQLYSTKPQTTFVPIHPTTLVQLSTGQIVPLTQLTSTDQPQITHAFVPITFPVQYEQPITQQKTTPVVVAPTQPTQFHQDTDGYYEKPPPTVATTQTTAAPQKPTPITTIHYFMPVEEELMEDKETTKKTTTEKKKYQSTTKPTKPTKPTNIQDDNEEEFDLFPGSLPTEPMKAVTQKPLKPEYPQSINDQLPPPGKATETTVPYVTSTTQEITSQSKSETTVPMTSSVQTTPMITTQKLTTVYVETTEPTTQLQTETTTKFVSTTNEEIQETPSRDTTPPQTATTFGQTSFPTITTTFNNDKQQTTQFVDLTTGITFETTPPHLTETTPQYIVTNIEADGTVTKTSSPLSTHPTFTTTKLKPIGSDFLADTENTGPVYHGNNREDINEDDIFGSTKQTPTTSTKSTSKATQSGLALELFGGNNRNAKLLKFKTDTKRRTGKPKIIYSNFYEASTVPPPTTPMSPSYYNTDIVIEPTRNYETTNEFYPLTSQSYSTSITFEVNKKDRLLLDNNVQYEPTIMAQLSEVAHEDGGYKIYKAELPDTTEMTRTTHSIGEDTKQVFDNVALQLINHARSIDYLSSKPSSKPTSKPQTKYKRRSYVPKYKREKKKLNK